MCIAKSLIALAFVSASVLSQAAGILIVQNSESRNTDPDDGHLLVQLLAEEFDNDGRVNPIAWSINDPVFRSAMDSKLVPSTDNPDIGQILSAADKLRAEYALVVTIFKKDADVMGRAALYRKGQLVWSDPQKPEDSKQPTSRLLTVFTNSRADVPNSLRAASRTWTQLIYEKPLKGLNPRPKIETPPPDPGTKPTIPDAPPPTKVDNRDLMASVMKLLAANKAAEAIALLRDAVDAEPVDPERRRALANALGTAGYNEQAAGEARRAADLFPEQVDLRTQAARFWMAAGKIDEANLDLNEAVARNPESVETRLLLGEVALGKLQVESAISHFDFAISKSPTADAHFKRALARAMNDDAEGCKQDMATASKLGLGKDPLEVRSQYTTAVRVSQAAVSEMGVAMRTLLQKARANFGNKEVREDQKVLARRCDSLIALFSILTPPPANKNSHGQRALALKLLGQSLSELGSYLDSGSDDSLGDATITLGEALKALAAADETYKSELR